MFKRAYKTPFYARHYGTRTSVYFKIKIADNYVACVCTQYIQVQYKYMYRGRYCSSDTVYIFPN